MIAREQSHHIRSRTVALREIQNMNLLARSLVFQAFISRDFMVDCRFQSSSVAVLQNLASR